MRSAPFRPKLARSFRDAECGLASEGTVYRKCRVAKRSRRRASMSCAMRGRAFALVSAICLGDGRMSSMLRFPHVANFPRNAIALAALLMLIGCAGYPPRGMRPGTTEAQVRQQM